MKLIVSIPAYNEAESIGEVVSSIPRKIKGVDTVEVLVIDDGSTDATANVARRSGAKKVVSHARNKGLAVAFQRGLDEALKRKADIIVNFDADGQYEAGEIERLIAPIVKNQAEVVLSDRGVFALSHMPLQKKWGNSLATFVTRFVSGFPVRDAQSGFRAFSREAALRLHVFSDYTYVQETIIQAASKRLAITQVPCSFHAREGPSRLISNILTYASRAGTTILRTYTHYKPLRVFLEIGSLVGLAGLVLGGRVIFHFLSTGKVSPFLPTAILSGVLLVIAFQIILLGLLADSVNAVRRIEEERLYLEKKRSMGE